MSFDLRKIINRLADERRRRDAVFPPPPPEAPPPPDLVAPDAPLTMGGSIEFAAVAIWPDSYTRGPIENGEFQWVFVGDRKLVADVVVAGYGVSTGLDDDTYTQTGKAAPKQSRQDLVPIK